MRSGGTRPDRRGQLVLAIGLWLVAWPVAANAQFPFGNSLKTVRSLCARRETCRRLPPVHPRASFRPVGNARRKGRRCSRFRLQTTPGTLQAHKCGTPMPLVPAGQGALAVSARFGRDPPPINGGLHWRVYPDGAERRPRLVKEENGPAPTFTLPAGSYVMQSASGLPTWQGGAAARRPARGLRASSRRTAHRGPRRRRAHSAEQISFDLYKGSQFERATSADRHRPTTGDVVLLPEGTYHIVSNYGDANSIVRSDIRVEVGKLTDTTVNHRAAIITLKLVSDRGGEALANTAWSVITPGGDVIEGIDRRVSPRVILSEGEYRAIAKNEGKVFERPFNVVNGVDGEVEVRLALAHGETVHDCRKAGSGLWTRSRAQHRGAERSRATNPLEDHCDDGVAANCERCCDRNDFQPRSQICRAAIRRGWHAGRDRPVADRGA